MRGREVEWLTLALWLLVLLIALPLGAGLLHGRVSLGLQAMAAGAGLALIVVYVIVGDSALAWVASGVALIGLLATVTGAVNLISAREDGVPAVSTSAEEVEAGLAGAQVPFFSVTLIVTLSLALGLST
jgi:hypothetical protein